MNSHSSPGARGELERKGEEGERGYKRVSELKVSWRSGDEVTRAGEDGRWGRSRSPEPEPRARLSSQGKCESESGARRGIGGNSRGVSLYTRACGVRWLRGLGCLHAPPPLWPLGALGRPLERAMPGPCHVPRMRSRHGLVTRAVLGLGQNAGPRARPPGLGLHGQI
jgi:hypothetical protein